ncbi:MAG TPA: urease accessory protein UreD [Steroidobacteraceae bacterium]|nr:urease accessory protein UreD [Steroidobacteraceae bacterium]
MTVLSNPTHGSRALSTCPFVGGVELEAEHTSRGSVLRRLTERGGFRARVTADGAVCEAYLVNPSGGLVGGDTVDYTIRVGPGAHLAVSTAAAERVYRADGRLTRLNCRMTVAAGATLEWLPQQTLLYDGCHYRRRLHLDVDPQARVTILEPLALGRAACGERLQAVDIRDDWRVHRGGELVFAEALRLVGAVSRLFERAAVGAGARATATLVRLAPAAEAELEHIRSCLDTAVLCAASAVEGTIVVRWLAKDAMTLTSALRSFLCRLRGSAPPRAW